MVMTEFLSAESIHQSLPVKKVVKLVSSSEWARAVNQIGGGHEQCPVAIELLMPEAIVGRRSLPQSCQFLLICHTP